MDTNAQGTRSVGGPTRRDVLLAAVSGAVAVLVLLVLPIAARADPSVNENAPGAGTFTWWAGICLLIAQAGALAWRRHHGAVVTTVVAAAAPVGALAGMGSTLGLTSVAILIAIFTVAGSPPRRYWTLIGGVFVAIAAGHVVAGLDTGLTVAPAVSAALLQAIAIVGAPLAIAALVAIRAESRSARAGQARALESAHEALVQRAIARERTAMARELHDIAAHHLTGIAIMSAAVSSQIDTDPAAAKESVGELRHQSTAVLRDLRSLVGLLRDDDTGIAPSGRGVESLAGIPDLVQTVVATGRDVGLTVVESAAGQPLGWGIGPLAQLAAHRMVQESLANAGRHATGARCEVRVDDHEPDALVVTVDNPPVASPTDTSGPSGFGLIGMQERAELTGSHLSYGPTADGGWQVRLRTPRAEPTERA